MSAIVAGVTLGKSPTIVIYAAALSANVAFRKEERDMSSLTDTQQAFVHRYMDDDNVIGVRVRELEGEIVLFVEVLDSTAAADLPDDFRDLRVVVHEGHRAVLAYR
jgi:hypothetical protein